ncbi:MAG: hypothetical protein PGN13_14290 [Patulibacter minatonensis]
MPRSPSDGAHTRSASEIDYPAPLAGQQAWARSGRDRRVRDSGPPNGVERRVSDRRSADRRRGADRRKTVRRSDGIARQSGLGMRSAVRTPLPTPRVASREHGPLTTKHQRTPKVLRALLVTAIAVGCLLAATLENAKAATGGAVTKTANGVTATVTYTRSSASGLVSYAPLRLTIRARGRTTARRLPITGDAKGAYNVRPGLTIRDVTGDGTPDVIVDVFSGGAHCCSVSAIARSTPKSWSKPLVHNWRDHGYRLIDAGGSATPEFVSDDARFTGAYAAYAITASPIQILSLEGGRMADVTRQFPDDIRTDVTQWQTRWQEVGKEKEEAVRKDGGRQAAAAWIADLLLLGDTDAAKAVYATASARGDFSNFPAGPGVTFGSQFGHDLKAWGYLTDPAVIGLTDGPAD